MGKGVAHLCPPFVGLVADGLCVCGPVGVDVGADVGRVRAVLDAGSDGVDGDRGRLICHCGVCWERWREGGGRGREMSDGEMGRVEVFYWGTSA